MREEGGGGYKLSSPEKVDLLETGLNRGFTVHTDAWFESCNVLVN